MHKKIMIFVLSFIVLTAGTAEAAPRVSAGPNVSQGPRRQVATIIFAGLAGAVLGLSTLSFYGRPQDKLPNIGVGFAMGVIAGASYTTYKAATQPRDYYGWNEFEAGLGSRHLRSTSGPSPIVARFQWSF